MLIGDRIEKIGIIFPKLNYQFVGQTDDGQTGVADKALMYAEFVRAAGGYDPDAVRAHFDFIDTSVCSGDGKAVGCNGAV